VRIKADEAESLPDNLGGMQSIKSDAEDRQELRISAVINGIRRYRARLISFPFRPHSGDIYCENKKKLPFSIRTDSFRAQNPEARGFFSKRNGSRRSFIRENKRGFP